MFLEPRLTCGCPMHKQQMPAKTKFQFLIKLNHYILQSPSLPTQILIRHLIFPKSYIQFYEEALKTSKTSKNLIAVIKAKYPSLTFETALQMGRK